MLFGAHVSISGGVEHAPENAAAIGCEVFQMFTRSPQGGVAPKLTSETVSAFLVACDKHEQSEWVVHAPYFINLANPQAHIRRNSVRLIREELERASLLRAAYVMFHPGSATGVGLEKALDFVVEGIKTVYEGYTGSTRLLVEISAGTGNVIGRRFEEVADIVKRVGHRELGVCFDTAHAFASGYDLRDKQAVSDTLREFDKTIGLDRLKVMHINDSKVELGARRDRHEHIGDGHIGKDGFVALVQHPKLKHVNFFCETEHDEVAKDIKILKTARGV